MRRGMTALVNIQTQGQYRRARRRNRIRWRERDESNRGRVRGEVRCFDGHSTCPRPGTKLGNGHSD